MPNTVKIHLTGSNVTLNIDNKGNMALNGDGSAVWDGGDGGKVANNSNANAPSMNALPNPETVQNAGKTAFSGMQNAGLL
jgi:hypothetical protein